MTRPFDIALAYAGLECRMAALEAAYRRCDTQEIARQQKAVKAARHHVMRLESEARNG